MRTTKKLFLKMALFSLVGAVTFNSTPAFAQIGGGGFGGGGGGGFGGGGGTATVNQFQNGLAGATSAGSLAGQNSFLGVGQDGRISPTTTQAVSTANPFNGTYYNPYTFGTANSQGGGGIGGGNSSQGSFGQPRFGNLSSGGAGTGVGGFGTTTGTTGFGTTGAGGRTGATGGIGGATGGVGGGARTGGVGGLTGGGVGGLGGGAARTGGLTGGLATGGLAGGGMQRTGGLGGTGVAGGLGAGGGMGFSTAGTPRTPVYMTYLGPTVRPRIIPPTTVLSNVQGVVARSTRLTAPGNISVSMDGDIVVLSGTVGTPREIDLVEGMIRLTPGVTNVRNDLRFNGPPEMLQGPE